MHILHLVMRLKMSYSITRKVKIIPCVKIDMFLDRRGDFKQGGGGRLHNFCAFIKPCMMTMKSTAQ